MRLPFHRRKTTLPLPDWARNALTSPRDALAWLPLDSEGRSWLIAAPEGLLRVVAAGDSAEGTRDVSSGDVTHEANSLDASAPDGSHAAEPHDASVSAAERSIAQPDAGWLAWDLITRGQWDADERALTLSLLAQPGQSRQSDHPARPGEPGQASRPAQCTFEIPPALHRVVEGRHVTEPVEDADFARVLRQHVESASVFHRRHYFTPGPGLEYVDLYIRRRLSGELYVCSVPPAEDPRLTERNEEYRQAMRELADSVGLRTV